MQQIIHLLNQKNQHLEKFLSKNEVEILNFYEGNFDGLEHFYNSREVLLDMINRVDRMIEEEDLGSIESKDVPANIKSQVIRALDHKNDLVTQILSQDLQILSIIEEAKSSIIKELREVGNTKKVIGSYKSGPAPQTLDEEV
ncbi:MAG: hypothetical protein HRT45_07970 [Bdellovibrionales bacterium]|nr:hypothetical protein [Bdellovibrionales bacterium]